MIGSLLTGKLYVHSQSIKVGNIHDSVTAIDEDESPREIERINYGRFDNAYREVACEDYQYLVGFQDNLKANKDKIFKQ